MMYNIPDKIMKEIGKTPIIIVCGVMGCGKSTLISEIGKRHPKKHMYVRLSYVKGREGDNHIYSGNGAEIIPDDKYFGKLAPTLKDNATFVIEDATGLSDRELRTINRYVYNLRKRDWQFIYAYHNLTKISMAILEDINTLLILKGEWKEASHTKLGHYLRDKKMVVPVEKLLITMEKYDTLYLSPDGSYFLNNKRGKVSPLDRRVKTEFTAKDDDIWDAYLNTKDSYREIGEEMGCSATYVANTCKDKRDKCGEGELDFIPRNIKIPVPEHGSRMKNKSCYIKENSKLDSSGVSSTSKKERIDNISKMEVIGNNASSIISDILWENIKDTGKSINLYHNLSKGPDISLTIDNRRGIDIEVKNFNISKNMKHLYPSKIKSSILPKFNGGKGEKWLFLLGPSPSKEGVKILMENNISLKRLSYSQLPINPNASRLYRLKKGIGDWVLENV